MKNIVDFDTFESTYDAKSYIGTYGNNTLAKRHAIADNIIAPLLAREEKNYTGLNQHMMQKAILL